MTDVDLSGATLDVNEFGPTVPRDGPGTARGCVLVRLACCNLDCGEGPGATWACDSPRTWRWEGRFDPATGPVYDPAEETRRVPVAELAEWVGGSGAGLCVVTGGEPLTQRVGVAALARRLTAGGVDVEVETNGTVPPGPATNAVTTFNVSPKLANSGVGVHQRLKPAVLDTLVGTGKARFTFVCADLDDLGEVDGIVGVANIPADRVWITAAGADADEVDGRLRLLGEAAVAAGWNIAGRLDVQLRGDRPARRV